MIKTFIIFFMALSLLNGLASYAAAQAAPHDREQGCTALLRHRTEALGQKDYPELATMARQFLRDCRDLYGAEEYSMAYLDLTSAAMERHDVAAALEASQRCIGVFYENAFCHVYKTWALMKSKRIAEARTESDLAEKLIGQLLEQNEKELGTATEQHDKEWYAVTEENLKASRRLLEVLRTKLNHPGSDEFKI